MSAVLERKSVKTQMSVEEFFLSPLSENHELVEGELVAVMPAGFLHGIITQEIANRLSDFVRENDLGFVVAAETGFVLGERTVRGADAAFISNEKIAEYGIPESYFPVAPDLAVETASPGNSAEELLTKVDEYIRGGSHLVWILHPKKKMVFVYRPDNIINILRENDTLEGENVLPGFSLPIADLFARLPKE